MKWSFKIGRLLGIELRVHLTFFLIVAYAAYAFASFNSDNPQAGAVYGAFVITVLFLCVVIHEMAHSKMAIHFGAEVDSITLLPIGGVSQLKSMPDEPKKELLVSIVGPLTNVIIALLLLPVVLFNWGSLASMTAEEFLDFLLKPSFLGFFTYILFINVMLAVFNLMPAFPLDGGRVLRSVLSMFMPSIQATRIAKTVGQTLAFLLGMVGLYTGAYLWIIIAVFIFFGASQEATGAEMKNILEKLTVRQALTGRHDAVRPEMPLGDVVNIALHSYQEDFPVLGGEGQLVGLLTRSNLLVGLHQRGPGASVGDVMVTEFPTVAPDADFARVFEKMNESGLKAIPVVDNGLFLGIITLEHLSEVFNLLSATENSGERRQRAGS
ncbi:MAG: site-2 protease family protein [Gaiellales bacterium]|nr:MAG: site-2 protease family protein [Gaiellales bacterium]